MHVYLVSLYSSVTAASRQDLFCRVPDEDLDVLDITGRPEDLIVTHVAVPPVAIRPSVEMDGASNEDDITIKIMVRCPC